MFNLFDLRSLDYRLFLKHLFFFFLVLFDKSIKWFTWSHLNCSLGIFDSQVNAGLGVVGVEVQNLVLWEWVLGSLHEVPVIDLRISENKFRYVWQQCVLWLNRLLSQVVRKRSVVLKLDCINSVGVHRDDIHDDLGRIINDLEAFIDRTDHVDVPAAWKSIHKEFTLEFREGKYERYWCRRKDCCGVLFTFKLVEILNFNTSCLNIDGRCYDFPIDCLVVRI